MSQDFRGALHYSGEWSQLRSILLPFSSSVFLRWVSAVVLRLVSALFHRLYSTLLVALSFTRNIGRSTCLLLMAVGQYWRLRPICLLTTKSFGSSSFVFFGYSVVIWLSVWLCPTGDSRRVNDRSIIFRIQ